jgi:hypothetical protein
MIRSPVPRLAWSKQTEGRRRGPAWGHLNMPISFGRSSQADDAASSQPTRQHHAAHCPPRRCPRARCPPAAIRQPLSAIRRRQRVASHPSNHSRGSGPDATPTNCLTTQPPNHPTLEPPSALPAPHAATPTGPFLQCPLAAMPASARRIPNRSPPPNMPAAVPCRRWLVAVQGSADRAPCSSH